MLKWKKLSIRKSIENYHKTSDVEHLRDIIRVYEQGGLIWYVKMYASEFWAEIKEAYT